MSNRTIAAFFVWLCAGLLALVGIYGLGYFLASVIQGGGLATGVGVPFQLFGVVLWVVFWGGALGLVTWFFRGNRRVTLSMTVLTVLMFAAAVVAPIAVTAA